MIDALVIGASGGIGQAVVAEMRARGGNVTTLSRREDGLDVTDPASVKRVMGALEGPFQTVFVAVGILAPEGGAPEKQIAALDPDEMARVFAVNTIGVANVLSHLPRLLPKRGRSVTGVLTARVGSIGDNQIGGWYSYRASKAALNQLLRTASIEIGRKRKRQIILALQPGTVDTALSEPFQGSAKSVMRPEESAAALLSVIDAATPDWTGGLYDWRGERLPW